MTQFTLQLNHSRVFAIHIIARFSLHHNLQHSGARLGNGITAVALTIEI